MSGFGTLLKSIANKNADASRVVGIDIGSSSIKVVELQNRDDVLTLTTYGELQTGPYANQPIGQSTLLDAKQEQQALIDIIRESAVKAKNAVFAMPLASSFVTSIHFEAPEEEDLSPRVRVEARKYIPVPINDVTLDWAEIGTKTEDGGRDVLIAAIQNEALNRFRILMQFVNLKEPPTEIECFSTIRSAFVPEEQHIAVIDFGAVSSKLFLAKDGLLQRMHRVRAGGAIATKRISELLTISFEEAEVMKRELRESSEKYRTLKRAHDAGYERPLIEFRQVLHEYETCVGTTVSSVYLAGSAVMFPGFRQHIADALGREVRFIDPFGKIAYPAFMEDMITELGPTFHVALGAALRRFE